MTLGPTGHGTWSYTTYLFDGTEKTVAHNPIATLNLGPGATTTDGGLISFNGWDDKNPSNTGLYLASPDLKDLRLVLPLQKGWLAVEPFGMSPDGSRIVFFVETGPDGEINHSGDDYVVSSDGTGLRRLNPAGETLGFIGMPTVTISPDGRQAAFATNDTLYVVDLEGGEARPITTKPGFAWAASWSPTGEWIAYAKFDGPTSVISLIRPDGTDEREISAKDETDEANAPVWSPDGKYLLVTRDSDATRDGPNDLWIIDLEGNYIGQVTHEPSHYGTYSWAPTPR
jgi:TolB protein